MNQMQECITACWDCRHECQETLFNHCLQKGEKHVEAEHVKIMTDCIQICQTAADFMTRNSKINAEVCKICAVVCDACAESCEGIDDKEMQKCAEVCRNCAKTCRSM